MATNRKQSIHPLMAPPMATNRKQSLHHRALKALPDALRLELTGLEHLKTKTLRFFRRGNVSEFEVRKFVRSADDQMRMLYMQVPRPAPWSEKIVEGIHMYFDEKGAKVEGSEEEGRLWIESAKMVREFSRQFRVMTEKRASERTDLKGADRWGLVGKWVKAILVSEMAPALQFFEMATFELAASSFLWKGVYGVPEWMAKEGEGEAPPMDGVEDVGPKGERLEEPVVWEPEKKVEAVVEAVEAVVEEEDEVEEEDVVEEVEWSQSDFADHFPALNKAGTEPSDSEKRIDSQLEESLAALKLEGEKDGENSQLEESFAGLKLEGEKDVKRTWASLFNAAP